MDWKLTDAKNRLSELVNRAASEGPQWIRRRNDAFVVLTAKEYEELTGGRRTLKQSILEAPDLDGLDLTRDETPMRRVEL